MKVNSSFWEHKRVFITGGTGFIGSHLLRKLYELKAFPRVFVHNNLPPRNSDIGCVGDLCNPPEKLKTFLESFKPQIIFHLAAQPIVGLALDDHFKTLEVNIRGTYNILSACYHLRWVENFVHISTDKVYGDVPEIQTGMIPSSTTHPYNTSKLSGDLLAQMYCNTFGTPITIIRNGNVYGPGDFHWDRLIPNTIRRTLSGEAPVIRGDGNSLRDYIYVDEIVQGYLNAAEYGCLSKGHPHIFNLGSVRPYKVVEVVDTILKLLQRIDLAPTMEPLGIGEIPNQHIVDETAERRIGWKPKIDLEDGLKSTIYSIWSKEPSVIPAKDVFHGQND